MQKIIVVIKLGHFKTHEKFVSLEQPSLIVVALNFETKVKILTVKVTKFGVLVSFKTH